MLQRGRTIGVRFLHGLAAALRRVALRRDPPDAHYKALVEQSTDGILIVGCKDGRVLYMNAALAARLGQTRGAATRLTLKDIFVGEELSVASLIAKFDGAGADMPVLLQQRSKGEACIDVEVRLYALTDAGRSAYAFIMRDVSVRNKVEQQLIENQQRLDRMAHHDQLTGLPNRHYLHAFLPDAIETAKTTATMLGVVFLDLDRFKHINDTRGHETGDKLLQEVARRVRACVRDSDVVIRMGGDEFVIVLRNVKTYEEISHGAGRIVATLNKPILVDGHPLQTTASVGVSIFPRDGANMMDLLKHSDTAMYQAKDRGRNNVQIFSAFMNRKLEHRVAVEASLREALRLKQLDVHYQPFVNLRSRKIVGLEALVRWRHPVDGMIPPDRFIPVAEETGLVVPIGNFVLHRTLQNMSAWKRAGVPLVPVSLNVSPAQLQRGELRSMIATLLATYGLPAELLQLELTERAVFDLSVPQAGESRRDSIAQVRDLGVKIAIDDFGTGYSSLSYLKHWQVDSLKIDKSFVRDLATDSSDLAIVSAIIAIAKHLRIEVVAEGIEGYQQAEILRNLGCHLGQGYLFARPVASEDCIALLAPQQTSARVEEEEIDMLAALKVISR